ncbi:hypothetical protein SUGI_0288110 [Cryptomeria japonica]|nr:hypothetical protein SUGI_0288110 [Cryptomeria japonica]
MGSKTCSSKDASVNSQGNVKNGESEDHFSGDEKDLINRLYNLLGDRWALIAGRLPGRTAEEIEKYWKRRSSDE